MLFHDTLTERALAAGKIRGNGIHTLSDLLVVCKGRCTAVLHIGHVALQGSL